MVERRKGAPAPLALKQRGGGLRHTFGTQCAAAGVPIRTIQEWMGHKDIQTTQRYADYAPSAKEAEMIATAFRRDAIGDAILSESKVIQEHPASATEG